MYSCFIHSFTVEKRFKSRKEKTNGLKKVAFLLRDTVLLINHKLKMQHTIHRIQVCSSENHSL